MGRSLRAALLVVFATALPASARTWTLSPPPPLPALPTVELKPFVNWRQTSLPQLPPIPDSASAPAKPREPNPVGENNRRIVLAQSSTPKWERVTVKSNPQAEVIQLATRPRWETVPKHERILHEHILAILAKPEPVELIILDRPPQRWESVSANQVLTHPIVIGDILRPVSPPPRRVWFRF